MFLLDMITEVIIWGLFKLFDLYSFIATIVLTLFFPVTKFFVDKKLKSFGIQINGSKPTDIQVLNPRRFYTRAAIEGAFGLFEGRLDKDWDVKDFKELIKILMASRRQRELIHPLTWVFRTFNLQTKARAWQVGKEHYDVANDIIESMLDKNLQYTCGYWKRATTLDEAQIAKMDLIARKLQLKPGMRVLDIGCGYGTLGAFLVKNYGVEYTGCSVSKDSILKAKEICKGLPCNFLLCDYRELTGKFDRVVSVGMFEHVGVANYRTFFEVCHRCLKDDDGIFLLHTIGNAHKVLVSQDAWVHKYIFPNGYVPYYMELCKALENLWVIEDWHNFGMDYSKTLTEWEKNFDNSWKRIGYKYGERYYLIFKQYLQSANACFESRSLHLWQLVLSKDGLKGGYHAPR